MCLVKIYKLLEAAITTTARVATHTDSVIEPATPSVHVKLSKLQMKLFSGELTK